MTGGAKERTGGTESSAFSPNGSNGANGSDGAHAASKSSGAPEPTSRDESDAATLTAPLVNAAAWWNMLQDQFKQAVNSAMTAESAAAEEPAETKEKPKAKAAPAAKPAASTTGTTRKRKTTK